MISDEAGCLPVFFFGLCFFQGRGMYRATWFVQYFNLSIANIGTIILAGQALKVCSMYNTTIVSIFLLWRTFLDL
jgi:hypothetical protein